MYDFNLPVTSNMNLDANWEINDEENKKYIVSFDSAGGTVIQNQTVKKGETTVAPINPRREGFMFKGWALDGKPFDFKTKITKDMTLVAEDFTKMYLNSRIYFRMGKRKEKNTKIYLTKKK